MEQKAALSERIYQFFASVRLTLFLFGALAATSVVGTLIPQESTVQQRLSAYGEAEGKYINALREAPSEEKAEVHFLLGECQRPLGKLDAARENFEKVPLHHERTPEAIRALA